jgi:hypothetical protein
LKAAPMRMNTGLTMSTRMNTDTNMGTNMGIRIPMAERTSTPTCPA